MYLRWLSKLGKLIENVLYLNDVLLRLIQRHIIKTDENCTKYENQTFQNNINKSYLFNAFLSFVY